MEQNKRLHAIMSGIVQGVGFRFFVYQHASMRNLKGWVRNCVNGDVEVLAEGPQSDLDYLLNRLEQGPGLSQVMNTEIEWLPYEGNLPAFTVLATK